jgi:hypothetical protein
MEGVKLFRQTGQRSFAVQLTPSGGVVEIRCSHVDAHPEESALQLFSRLSTCSGGHVGGLDGDEDARLGSWSVSLVDAGKYCIKSRAFVGCHLKMRQLKIPCESQLHTAEDFGDKKNLKRTKKLAWLKPGHRGDKNKLKAQRQQKQAEGTEATKTS